MWNVTGNPAGVIPVTKESSTDQVKFHGYLKESDRSDQFHAGKSGQISGVWGHLSQARDLHFFDEGSSDVSSLLAGGPEMPPEELQAAQLGSRLVAPTNSFELCSLLVFLSQI